AGWLLMVLPMLPVGLGAVRLVRDVAHLERRERIIAWCAYPAAVVVAGLLLAGLSTGGIGDGRLVHLGPQMSTLALPLIGIVVVSTGSVLAVLATPLVPWSRRTLGSVRDRVEAAERQEQGETDAAGAEGTGAGRDAAAERSALLERFARRNPPTMAASPAPSSATGPSADSAPSASADSASEPETAPSPGVASGREHEERDGTEGDDLERDLWAVEPQQTPDDATGDEGEGEGEGEEKAATAPATRRPWLTRRRDR